MKIKLNSTQVVVEVEVRVELGNNNLHAMKQILYDTVSHTMVIRVHFLHVSEHIR